MVAIQGNTTKHPVDDYFWSGSDEPHATRRKEILAKYPKVRTLFGFDWTIKYVCAWWVITQLALAYFLRESSIGLMFVVTYCYGAFAAQALFLGMHEISHNLAFEKSLHNSIFGSCFANIATVIPHFSMFQKFHMEHHQYQGVDGIDSDIPSRWEGSFFTNVIKKTLWVAVQPLFYITRPFFIKPKVPGKWEAINWATTFLVDALVLYFWGWRSLYYLLSSALIAGGLHPSAGHFISEHYVFIQGQETYSYYGIMNLITFNVGYHNEHHDFPRIPGSRLPELKKMAPEFYDVLPYHTSYIKVIWDYITDPNVGPYSRVLRKERQSKST